MKKCSYCGHENDDGAAVCCECGTGFLSPSAAVIEPQLTDPANGLVIVRTFSTMEQASLLAIQLRAAGIEACIPEEYGGQPFSDVVALSLVTVRVAAKDRESAEEIAVEMAGGDRVSAAAEPVPPPPPQRRFAITRTEITVISAVLVLLPVILGTVAHYIRDRAAMGPVFWVWVLFTIACFVWSRYLVRRFRRLAWECVAVDILQVTLFLFLFFTVDFPANSRSRPYTPQPTPNRHNW